MGILSAPPESVSERAPRGRSGEVDMTSQIASAKPHGDSLLNCRPDVTSENCLSAAAVAKTPHFSGEMRAPMSSR
eukprot:7561605-Alexandrium_andersonii.AAC.1